MILQTIGMTNPPSKLQLPLSLEDCLLSSSSAAASSKSSLNHHLSQNSKFPCRLHRMLDEAESHHLDHIVSWLPCGTAFAIHDKEEFMKSVIPNYFPRMTSYKSFRRQLSLYGIYQRRVPAIRKNKKKVTSSPGGSPKSTQSSHQEGGKIPNTPFRKSMYTRISLTPPRLFCNHVHSSNRYLFTPAPSSWRYQKLRKTIKTKQYPEISSPWIGLIRNGGR